MKFDAGVSTADRRKIIEALQDIKHYGTNRQGATARFIEESLITIYVGLAKNVRGSGSVGFTNLWRAQWAILRGEFSPVEAAKFVRLSIARETIDTGKQRGIEGTLVHEGKHALDFARMLASFSGNGDNSRVFNPTLFQVEYSAHLTAAFYLKRRGGEFAREGVELGILSEDIGKFCVSRDGIRERLRNNYGLTPKIPGRHLNMMAFPPVMPRNVKFWGFK
ncbi:hypothetical protein BH10ACI1_BH10ACI1_11000 [soil metagenome]